MSPNDTKSLIMRSIAIELIINGLFPYLIYSASVSRLGEWPALILASVPPLINSVREFALRRRVDTIGALALTGILFSLISLSLGGSAHALMLRGVVITGLFGIIYLVSMLVGRPVIFYIVRFLETGDKSEGIAQWDGFWKNSANFRYGVRVMNIVWGLGLLAKALVQFVLVQTLTVEQILLVSPAIDNVFFLGLFFWSLWYGNRMKQMPL
jgi:hypothetical protein